MFFFSLARQLQKVHSATSSDFTEDQKVFINSVEPCFHQFGILHQLKWGFFLFVSVFSLIFLENHRKDCNMSGNEKCQFAGLGFLFFSFFLLCNLKLYLTV